MMQLTPQWLSGLPDEGQIKIKIQLWCQDVQDVPLSTLFPFVSCYL